MRPRHRIPSLFNLSMVDVLCCALGCVILVWLLNLREAKNSEETASARISTALELQEGAEKQTREWQQKFLAADKAWGQEKQTLQTQIDDEKGRTAKALADYLATQEMLTATRKLTDEEKKRGESLVAKIAELGLRIKDLEALETLLPQIRADLEKAKKDLALEKTQTMATKQVLAVKDQRLDDLLKEITQLRDLKIRLENELARSGQKSDALEKEVGRIRTELDNRFAGITLTGNRVIFMVDRSGSMKDVAENVPDNSKWPEVASTVGKLMKSIPRLQKYQVIVFNENAEFLLGSPGKWLDYDRDNSAIQVEKQLLSLEVKGATNMHVAMDMAFQMRGQGLDAIYLLSDGLPNRGPVPQGRPDTDDNRSLLIRQLLAGNWNAFIPNGPPRVQINTVGFYYESPDLGRFLWALARENNGSFVGMSKP